jgi:hypothetical protein
VAALVVFLVVKAWNRNASLESDLAKERELREKLQGKLVEEDSSKKEMASKLKDAQARVPELEAQVKDLEGRVGKVKPIRVVEIVTVPGAATGTPRPCPLQPPQGVQDPSPTGCLVATGDIVRAQVDEVTVETKAGNQVVLGAASCWRESPPPETMFYRGNFEAKTSTANVTAEPSPVRWGAGLTFMATTDKVGVGPLVLFPPVRVWGLEGDISAGFAAGLGGFVGGSVNAGLRW